MRRHLVSPTVAARCVRVSLNGLFVRPPPCLSALELWIDHLLQGSFVSGSSFHNVGAVLHLPGPDCSNFYHFSDNHSSHLRDLGGKATGNDTPCRSNSGRHLLLNIRTCITKVSTGHHCALYISGGKATQFLRM